MRQAANIMDLEIDMLMPGIKVNTSPHGSCKIDPTSRTGGRALPALWTRDRAAGSPWPRCFLEGSRVKRGWGCWTCPNMV
jgi:hypothetical protein